MNTPQFDAFLSHCCACPKCHPRHDIYCLQGRELWLDDQAAFVANLPTLAQRQHWLSVIAAQAPHYIVQIKKRVRQLFNKEEV